MNGLYRQWRKDLVKSERLWNKLIVSRAFRGKSKGHRKTFIMAGPQEAITEDEIVGMAAPNLQPKPKDACE
jgi:hypothetical protein